jgi:hypothetical protein
MGTKADGVSSLHSPSALDVQLWAQLLPDAPTKWRRALNWVERMNAVKGGFDFTDTRDGLWTEGTAQAALVYRRIGNETTTDALFVSLMQQASPGGYLYATPNPRVTTVYSYYYHQPSLAATAWAVLAALNRNPYVSTSTAKLGNLDATLRASTKTSTSLNGHHACCISKNPDRQRSSRALPLQP